MRRYGRRGYFSILEMVIYLVIALVVLYFIVFPLVRKVRKGGDSAFVCNGECLAVCPSDTMHQLSGDQYCQDTYGGAGGKCCESLVQPEGQIFRRSDIRLYFNGQKDKPLGDGATVSLVPNKDATSATGTFSLSFGDTLKDKKCYWLVGDENGQNDVLQCEGSQIACQNIKDCLFQDLYKDYEHFQSGRGGSCTGEKHTINNLHACSDYEGKSTMTVEKMMDHLGEKYKFTLVVVDPDSCESGTDVDFCSSDTYTVFSQIPDRTPALSLNLDKKKVAENVRTPITAGTAHALEAVFKDPLKTCTVTYATLAGVDKQILSSKGEAIAPGKDLVPAAQCFAINPYSAKASISVVPGVPASIPFSINVTTTLDKRVVTKTYDFQVAPETRVTVTGPQPGLTKEKTIEIGCDGVTCTSFEVAYVTSPLSCSDNPVVSSAGDETFQAVDGLEAYGGQASGRWRFAIDNETVNGKYVCIRAETDTGKIYSLGLWNGLPQPISIDHTAPQLLITFNPWQGELSYECYDGQGMPSYRSGCKKDPFSYAYVVDPLKFVSYILTGGALASTFNSCPQPDNDAAWRPLYETKMPYIAGNEVRVICVRATDAAGNSVVKTKLLYSGQAALAAFLVEYQKH